MDICHAKYFALLEKKTFLAPIGENPQRILDLGCGTGVCDLLGFPLHRTASLFGPKLMLCTGIWAIEVADEYASAQVQNSPCTVICKEESRQLTVFGRLLASISPPCRRNGRQCIQQTELR